MSSLNLSGVLQRDATVSTTQIVKILPTLIFHDRLRVIFLRSGSVKEQQQLSSEVADHLNHS